MYLHTNRNQTDLIKKKATHQTKISSIIYNESNHEFLKGFLKLIDHNFTLLGRIASCYWRCLWNVFGIADLTSTSEGCDADLIGVIIVVTSAVQSGGEEIDVVDSMSQYDARSAKSLKYHSWFSYKGMVSQL